MVPGWLDSIDDDVTTCLCRRGSLSPRELAEELGISESSALSYIFLLASAGRLTIERVGLRRTANVSRRRHTGQLAA